MSEPPAPDGPALAQPDDAPGSPAAPLPRARLRRAPRYGVFTGLGAALGIVAAVVLTFVFPSGRYSYGAVLGYLVVALGVFGALVGALVGVVAGIRVDRRR